MSIAELVTIGNEILDGRVTDTNRVYLGKRLKELDFEVRYAQSVDDNFDRIVAALQLATSRSDIVVCTGGLGPTTDDMTSEAVAKFLNCPWQINSNAETFLRELFQKRNRALSESQLKQAKLPALCEMIHNPVGTAPGFSFKGKIGTRTVSLYFYPGIPREMHPMFEESVAKDATLANQQLQKNNSLKNYTWSTIFTSEGDLQEKVKEVEKTIAPFKIGFRTQLPENFVALMGRVENENEEKLWQNALTQLKEILSPLSYAEGVEKIFDHLVFNGLVAKKARVLFVESCTGGLLSHLLTDLSGSSEVLWGSQVCYANDEKILLGVNPETIKKHGAVSAECAREMALGGLERLKKSSNLDPKTPLVAVSTTGIAGPLGGSDHKPVGLMYVAVAILGVPGSEPKCLVEKTQAPQFLERKLMKLYMAKKALDYLRVNFL